MDEITGPGMAVSVCFTTSLWEKYKCLFSWPRKERKGMVWRLGEGKGKEGREIYMKER